MQFIQNIWNTLDLHVFFTLHCMMCFKYVVCIALWSLLKKINEKLYKIHLECAYKWPTTWQMVQTAIDNNIQLQMEKQYANLNKKTGQPNQETNRKPHNETRRRQQPVPYKNRKSHKHHVQQRRVKLWCMSWNQNWSLLQCTVNNTSK